LPNVLLEAQVLKTYIVSTNCPTGPKEILLNGKAGSLFKIGDDKGLSKLILNFSKNRGKYLKMIKFGYQNLFRFNYKNNLNKYFQEVNSLIK
jgi:glycosyltransferase involved in cell wall biosynthesis